jgi:hypothetical protein
LPAAVVPSRYSLSACTVKKSLNLEDKTSTVSPPCLGLILGKTSQNSRLANNIFDIKIAAKLVYYWLRLFFIHLMPLCNITTKQQKTLKFRDWRTFLVFF